MLEAEVRDGIAQREEPVVVSVVIRAEERRRLVDEPAVLRREIVRRLGRLRTLGQEIQRVAPAGLIRDVDLPQDCPELYGRIDEGRQRGRLELDLIAVAAARLQRRRVLPAGRNAQGRLDLQRVAAASGPRIKQNGVPAQHAEAR